MNIGNRFLTNLKNGMNAAIGNVGRQANPVAIRPTMVQHQAPGLKVIAPSNVQVDIYSQAQAPFAQTLPQQGHQTQLPIAIAMAIAQAQTAYAQMQQPSYSYVPVQNPPPPSYAEHMALKESREMAMAQRTPQEGMWAAAQRNNNRSAADSPPSYQDHMAASAAPRQPQAAQQNVTPQYRPSGTASETFQPTQTDQNYKKTFIGKGSRRSSMIKAICKDPNSNTDAARKDVLKKLWDMPTQRTIGGNDCKKFGDIIKHLMSQGNLSENIEKIQKLADTIIKEHNDNPAGMSMTGFLLDSAGGIFGTVGREVIQRKKDGINIKRSAHQNTINQFLIEHTRQ